jgi:predicted O-methyltransferase YrrM
MIPLNDIPFCQIDLGIRVDPVPAILSSREFAQADDYFTQSPTLHPALVSVRSQALLYILIRNLKAEHVVEVGTFYAGTSEVICRALHANRRGMLHTTDPYGVDRVPGILAQWPEELRKHVVYYPLNSMGFFEELARMRIQPDLVFVDGNHDYEFALFDVQCSARYLRPGGFIVIDNANQAGPFFAAQDFLARHPAWVECRLTAHRPNNTKAFDPERSNIPGTDFILLRAPSAYLIDIRPFSPGEIPWNSCRVDGLRLSLLSPPGEGVLHVQLVLRGFSGQRNVEQVVSSELRIRSADAGFVEIRVPITIPGEFDRYTVEPWMIWVGSGSLTLNETPMIF